jgi:hypothetical protein
VVAVPKHNEMLDFYKFFDGVILSRMKGESKREKMESVCEGVEFTAEESDGEEWSRSLWD